MIIRVFEDKAKLGKAPPKRLRPQSSKPSKKRVPPASLRRPALHSSTFWRR